MLSLFFLFLSKTVADRSEGTIPKSSRGHEGVAELRDGEGDARGEVPQGRTRTAGNHVEALQETNWHPRDAQAVSTISGKDNLKLYLKPDRSFKT